MICWRRADDVPNKTQDHRNPFEDLAAVFALEASPYHPAAGAHPDDSVQLGRRNLSPTNPHCIAGFSNTGRCA
jgi:hypothetical protein